MEAEAAFSSDSIAACQYDIIYASSQAEIGLRCSCRFFPTCSVDFFTNPWYNTFYVRTIYRDL